MKKLLTLCFYENPAALHEIEQWEKTKTDQIKSKTTYINGRIDFLLEREDGQVERLVCYPNDVYVDQKPFYDINQQVFDFLNKDYKYHKTLLFGKFNSEQMMAIYDRIFYYERF